MNSMNLFVNLQPNYQVSYDEFVGFWKEQYSYPNEHWYYNNIKVAHLTVTNLQELFCWKNGMNLSGKKQAGFDRIAGRLDVINTLRSQFVEDTYEHHFGRLTPVWKIFLKHIASPKLYPIFDQHVHRAFRYLKYQDVDNLPVGHLKEEIYNREYLPFYVELETQCTKLHGKQIDNALWAFGKFLSRYPKMLL